MYIANSSPGSKVWLIVRCEERADLSVPVAVLDPHQRKADLKTRRGSQSASATSILILNNQYASHHHTRALLYTQKPPVKSAERLIYCYQGDFRGKFDVSLLYDFV